MRMTEAVTKGFNNKLYPEDSPAHEWYRFVLSFPPHLVRDYASHFGIQRGQLVLDPFCGTGTTLVECKKLGINSAGVEAMPMARFASAVKTDWGVDPQELLRNAARVARTAATRLTRYGTPEVTEEYFEAGEADRLQLLKLPKEAADLLLRNSISPVPLHKTLILLHTIREVSARRVAKHLELALARALISDIGNIAFGPEIGVTKPKFDCPVIHPWLQNVERITLDLGYLSKLRGARTHVRAGDARSLLEVLTPASVNLVLTSPPYPNEKDYTRTTRLESVILGFLNRKADLKDTKRLLVRSNTRTIYKGDDDAIAIAHIDSIQNIAAEIEGRRVTLKKTSGFERLYGTVVKEYFGGMAKHLTQLKPLLAPNARLVYVVGDQASYFQVLIQTGRLLAEVAESVGFTVEDIHLFRSRLSTATKQYLREEAVVLKYSPPRVSVSINGYPAMNTKADNDSGKPHNRYIRIIEQVFRANYTPGAHEVVFERDDLERIAKRLKINLPKNLGDLIYSFRHRVPLPDGIRNTAPEGREWIIRPKGRGRYSFALTAATEIKPGTNRVITKIPDATPGIVTMHTSQDHKQALLVSLRYSRLIDTFTGVTLYPIQSHLRTFVAGIGQIETDELYIGVDKKGIQYVVPVQAKAGKEKLSAVDIEHAFALCASKFPSLMCRPVGAQFMRQNYVVLFAFERGDEGVKILNETHYELVSANEITPELLAQYQQRLSEL